jgi:hypothetical protein
MFAKANVGTVHLLNYPRSQLKVSHPSIPIMKDQLSPCEPASGQPSPVQASKEAKGQALLRRLQEQARQRGLECLNSIWLGKNSRYRLRCANGHEFDLQASSIRLKTAHCNKCRQQERLQAVVQMAIAKDGRCLETQYLGDGARYRFVCAQGHAWAADPISMRSRDSWCPHCALNHQRRFFEDGLGKLQRTASEKGGQCLSETYTGTRTYYIMQCAKGHQWQAKGAELLGGSWCAECAYFERTTRQETKAKPRYRASLGALGTLDF